MSSTVGQILILSSDRLFGQAFGVQQQSNANALVARFAGADICADSFEHSVKHTGEGQRLVLIVDMLHPDLEGKRGQHYVGNEPPQATGV